MVNTIWEEMRSLIEQELSAASYKGLIVPLVPISIDHTEIILQTKSAFNQTQLYSSRYYQILQNAALQTTGKKLTVKIVLPEDISPVEKQNTVQQNDSLPAITMNPRYTFETFVIGSSNRFAHAAAIAIANNPGKSYNPLFVYGGAGLGKTHLMHAIGNELLLHNPHANIMYVTSEKFTNELITAIRSDQNENFRAKYRNVDMLMIDDIQFISNKEGTQEEFFHTFNALYDNQKQIIISSDKPPKEIPTLEERLRSRFEWGLIADIQPPDHETRVAILQRKAIDEHLDISQEVFHLIADVVESNIRELEGTLTRIVAYSNLTGKPLTIEVAHEALTGFYTIEKREKREVNVDLIQEVVADYYQLDREAFMSSKRNRDIAYPRQIAMYLTREILGMSFPKIGEAFGGRDHSTVQHACHKITKELKKDPKLQTILDDLTKRIHE